MLGYRSLVVLVTLLLGCLPLLLGASPLPAQDDKAPPPKYMGSKACKKCHMKSSIGKQYKLDQPYNEIRKGARLLIAYDKSTNTFVGAVWNTTRRTLESVRVEIHTSDGMELGPTVPVRLGPGVARLVVIPAGDQRFETFGAHPEVGIERD